MKSKIVYIDIQRHIWMYENTRLGAIITHNVKLMIVSVGGGSFLYSILYCIVP